MATSEQENAPPEDSTIPGADVVDGLQSSTGLPPSSDAGQPALREDQLRNAVAFLAHPKVRDSTEASKREFLERKGLSGPEIAEAFRRVPAAPAPSSAGLGASSGAPPPKPFPTATVDQLHALQPYNHHHQQQPGPGAMVPAPEPIRWSQVVLGGGVVAAGAYVLGVYVAPRVTSWARGWWGGGAGAGAAARREREEEAAAAAKLVAEALAAQTAEVRGLVAALREAVGQLRESAERAPEPPSGVSLADLRAELRGVLAALPAAASSSSPSQRHSGSDPARPPAPAAGSVSRAAAAATATANGDGPGDGPGAAAASPAPSTPPQGPSGYLSDSPTPPSEAPHSAPYNEVLEMLSKGETPPGIRTDIVDTPPNPHAPLPASRLQPRPKPWEQREGKGPTAGGTPKGGSSSTHSAGASGGSGGEAEGELAGLPKDLPVNSQPTPHAVPGTLLQAPQHSAPSGLSFPPASRYPARLSSDGLHHAPPPAALGDDSGSVEWQPPAAPRPSLPKKLPTPAVTEIEPDEAGGGDE